VGYGKVRGYPRPGFVEIILPWGTNEGSHPLCVAAMPNVEEKVPLCIHKAGGEAVELVCNVNEKWSEVVQKISTRFNVREQNFRILGAHGKELNLGNGETVLAELDIQPPFGLELHA